MWSYGGLSEFDTFMLNAVHDKGGVLRPENTIEGLGYTTAQKPGSKQQYAVAFEATGEPDLLGLKRLTCKFSLDGETWHEGYPLPYRYNPMDGSLYSARGVSGNRQHGSLKEIAAKVKPKDHLPPESAGQFKRKKLMTRRSPQATGG